MSTGAELQFAAVAYDDPVVVSLVEILQADFVERYGGPDATRVDPAQFAPPAGLFVVGSIDPVDPAGPLPVAMGGYRSLGPSYSAVPTAEIKRMWVRPSARGHGYARAVLAHLETAAAREGIAALVLNTGRAQPEAMALYESSGYAFVDPFGHYAATPGALFYGKVLVR